MRSPNTFPASRGITKILYPMLSTGTKNAPLTARSHGEYSGHEMSRTGRTPPPAPRLRPIPLPPLDFTGRHIGLTEDPVSPQPRQTFLHRILAYPLTYSSLSYDVSTPPSTLRFLCDGLSESAFWPFPSRIEVVCDGLPWTIEITSPRDTPLTCLAVLCEMHSALTRTVSELEWAVASPAMQRVAWGTYLQRVQQSGSGSNPGVQRLDFLASKTRFLGLSPFRDRCDKWVMHLDFR